MREYTIISTENNKASPLKTIAERIYTKSMSAGYPGTHTCKISNIT